MIWSLCRSAFLATLLASLLPTAAADVKLPTGFTREVLAGPELKEPMDLTFAPDGAAWITGRTGEIWRLEPNTREKHQVGSIATDYSGDRGLHGLALHPDFARNGELFVFYHATNRPAGKYRSRVSRWTVEGTGPAARLNPTSETVLLEFDGDEGHQHVGGGLLAHPVERVLYVTTGDNNVIWELKKYCNDPENRAQSTADLRGKVLRIGFDGSAPVDNPHQKTPGARPEVFTRGHRQPWQLSFDRPTGLLLLAENGGDELDDVEEINRLQPGGNYGWPKAFGNSLETATRTNRVEGLQDPWFKYARNNGGSCSGALIYRAPAAGGFPERFRGGLFYSDYNRKTVRFAPVDATTLTPGASESFAQNLPGGPVSLRLGPDGALYLVEYGGWFQSTTNDTVSRIVFRP
ncbi:MAG: PQQ-dependent sugar dehydrogenase [Verrucomicrobia bacterium]|nr:PQQ-dependent sugar dehydrogenase [Verrucomicrobiota bacterium]